MMCKCITSMKGIQMPKAVSLSVHQEQKCNCGAPKLHYKDQLKGQLTQAEIDHQSLQLVHSDLDSRHSFSARKGSFKFLTDRHMIKSQRKDIIIINTFLKR